MSCKWNTVRCMPCITLAMAVGTVSPTVASTYWEPAITLSVIHDDNVFIRPTLLEADTITRLTPSLELGHESPRTLSRVFLSQDMERYENNPELDSSKIRRFIEGSILHDVSERTVLALDAGLNESRIPSDINLTTGFGTGRAEGRRTFVNPAIGHHFSRTMSGLAELTIIRDRIDIGEDADTNQVNLELEQFLTANTQMLYGYRHSRFQFGEGETVQIHVPSVGVVHRFSEHGTLTAVAGPRFSENDDTGLEASLLYQQQYGRGIFLLGYERRATTLIGERGVVELDAFRTELSVELTPRLHLDFAAGYSRIGGDLTVQAGTEAVRGAINAGYRFNQYVQLGASWTFTEQKSSGNTFEQFTVPRNVALLSVTFQFPRSSDPAPRTRPQARSQVL